MFPHANVVYFPFIFNIIIINAFHDKYSILQNSEYLKGRIELNDLLKLHKVTTINITLFCFKDNFDNFLLIKKLLYKVLKKRLAFIL